MPLEPRSEPSPFDALERVEAHWRAALSHLLHERTGEAASEVEQAQASIAEVHRLEAGQDPLVLLELRRRIDALHPLHLELTRLSERARSEAAEALAHAAQGKRTLQAYSPSTVTGPGRLA